MTSMRGPKIQSGIWVVEGSEIEDVNGLYAFAVYNKGLAGIVKISHEQQNKYYEIRDNSNNNKTTIFNEYELVQHDSIPNEPNNKETGAILYKYKNNKLEYVSNSDKQTTTSIKFINNTTLSKFDDYRTKYTSIYLPNRFVPNLLSYSNELNLFLSDYLQKQKTNLPNTIIKTIVNEYVLCDHKHSKIGMFRVDDCAKYDVDLKYLVLFCNFCHFIWTLPQCIHHYGHGYNAIFPNDLLKNISFYLDTLHAGRGGYGHRYPIGHGIGWSSFDIVPFKSDDNNGINHGWTAMKFRKETYFEYVAALNQRILDEQNKSSD